jgi:hypothetical protein
MKAARPLLIGISVIIVVLLIAFAIAMNTSVQTWAARRELARQPNMRGTVGEVSVGFHRTTVKTLKVESRGAVLTVPSLELEMPVLAAGLQRRVDVHQLTAKGWTLDLSKVADLSKLASLGASPSSTREAIAQNGFSLLSSAYAADASSSQAKAASGFAGIFGQLQLPVDLSVDAMELEGEVILPPQIGRVTSRLRVVIHGGGLKAHQEGTFITEVGGATSDGGAVTLHGTISAKMDTPRSFTELTLKMDSSASGTQLPGGVTLHVDATAARTPSGETYTTLLSTREKDLATLKADYTVATSHIAGTWQVNLRDTDIAPFLLGRKTPTFTTKGQGSFDTGTALDEVHATGSFDLAADHLEFLRPELSSVGATSLVADFDMLQHGDSLRVERLNATMAGSAPVATVTGLQSFEFNLKSGELRVADPSKDLVGISLTGLPLAWARAFLGPIQITGGDVRGEFALSAREGGLGLRPVQPLSVQGVSVANAGAPLLNGVDLLLSASGDYTPAGWQADVKELVLSHGGVALLSLAAKAGRLAGANQPLKATGQWTGDLAAWAVQPVAAGKFQLANGAAKGDFKASIDGTKALETTLSLSDLVANSKEKLPAVRFELRADIASDGKTTFNAPVTFTIEKRVSDLLLAGVLTPGAAAFNIDARLTSGKVVMQDVQLLALLVPKAPAAPETPDSPDEKPFWGALTGQVTLAIKQLVYSEAFEVSDVAGTLRLEPTALTLQDVRAAFGPDSDLKLSGGMTFDAKVSSAYSLVADVALNNFDTAPAFKALDPAKLPTLEARVNLNTHVVGTGTNVPDVAEHARGDVQVTAKSGLFRALSADVSDKIQKTQSTVAAIGGILGGLTGKKEYADYANKTQILTDITKALSEIPFDQLNVTATRDPELNMVLKDFTLISPEVRLTGGGTIQHVEGIALLAQPLNLQLNLGARGKLADLMKRAGLLEDKKDNLGYAAFVTPIKIAGTLEKTNTSELKNALLNSALEKGGLLDNLLGK